jgi:hypothetical protein
MKNTFVKIEKRPIPILKTKDGKAPFADKLAKANAMLAKADLSILFKK